MRARKSWKGAVWHREKEGGELESAHARSNMCKHSFPYSYMIDDFAPPPVSRRLPQRNTQRPLDHTTIPPYHLEIKKGLHSPKPPALVSRHSPQQRGAHQEAPRPHARAFTECRWSSLWERLRNKRCTVLGSCSILSYLACHTDLTQILQPSSHRPPHTLEPPCPCS